MLYMTIQCSFHNNPLRSGYDYIHLMDKETELKKIHMPFSKTYGRKIAKLRLDLRQSDSGALWATNALFFYIIVLTLFYMNNPEIAL